MCLNFLNFTATFSLKTRLHHDGVLVKKPFYTLDNIFDFFFTFIVDCSDIDLSGKKLPVKFCHRLYLLRPFFNFHSKYDEKISDLHSGAFLEHDLLSQIKIISTAAEELPGGNSCRRWRQIIVLAFFQSFEKNFPKVKFGIIWKFRNFAFQNRRD